MTLSRYIQGNMWISYTKWVVFTCVSYAEAGLSYRLDGRLSVRLSVRPSVTRWYCIKTAEHIIMLSSPHDSPFILVLCISRSSWNSDGVTPWGAAKQRWRMKMSQFSTNNLLLQPLNPLSNRVTFTAIVPGAYPGEAKMCLLSTYRRDSREVAK